MDLLPSNRWILGINGISHLDCKNRNLKRWEENFGEGNLSEGKSEIRIFSDDSAIYFELQAKVIAWYLSFPEMKNDRFLRKTATSDGTLSFQYDPETEYPRL